MDHLKPMALRRMLPLVAMIAAMLLAPAVASADRSFTTRFSANDTGDIAFVGNTLMSCPDSTLCTQARNGTATPISNLQNNSYAMTYVDVDSDSSTFNSSTAGMSLPSGSQVLWAGLYWGGDYSGSGNNAAPNASNRNKALFKVPGDSAYRTITASTVDESTASSGRYQAFADVTSIVAAAGNGTYATANVQAAKGSDHYAIWQLVVAYRDTTQPARNLTVFDGLVTINGSAGATIPVSGFRTPPAGAVKTTLGFITYEGDLGIEGDGASLNGTPLQDALNPQTNFFNSTISNRGSRVTTKNPDYVNQLGIDADLFNADGMLGNNATSANIQVTTSGDVYLPGVLTFATELYAPKIDQTKTFTDLNGGSIEEGDILEYKIAATNNGQDGAVGFTLRDPIPANTTYVPGSLRVVNGAGAATGTRTDAAGDDNGEFDSANNRVVTRLGTGANASTGGKVAVGGSYDVRFQVRVSNRLAPDTRITNTATASFFSESLNTPLTAASTPDLPTVVKAPDLAITKSHTGPVTPGGSATYKLDVKNEGNAQIRGTTTTVTDTLPAELAPTSATGTGWSCSISGQTVTCTRSDDLAAGASYPEIQLGVSVAETAGTPIRNTATVSNPADANPANDSSEDPAPTTPSADLSIRKSASPGTVNVGDQVTFTLDVANDGPSVAANVSVLDSLPSGLELVSTNPSQGSCDATISCSLGTIARNGTAQVTVVAKALSGASGSTLRSTATVSGGLPDPNPANDSSSADVSVAGADLKIEKTISNEHPNAGEPVRYTLLVTNGGPSSATPVVVRDALPSKLGSISTDRGECSVSGHDVVCTFPSMASGGTETVHVDATVLPGAADGALDNTASVSGPGVDPDPSNDSSTAKASVGSSADLSLTKTADVSGASAGDQVTYTLAAHNDGPSAAANARIVDTLPAGVSFVSASPGCAHSSGVVTCQLGTLAAGGDASRTVTVRIEPSAVGTLSNSARVGSDTTDPDHGNDEDFATTQISSQADLSLTKAVSPANAVPGDTVTYTMTVRNDGPATAHDVVVGDTMPGGVTFVDSDPAAPTCEFADGSISCELGSLASGATRTVTVRATVDALSYGDDHRHLMPVEKVEQQVDLESGQVRDVTLSCPTAGEVMTDGSVRVDAVDQGTGSLGSVETRRARSTAPGRYEFTVANNAGGRAQAKVFGVCIPSVTQPEAGHTHRVLVSDPVTVTSTLPQGRTDVEVPCAPGTVAIAPGIDVSGGEARIVGSEPNGNGRRFTIDATVDATTVELSVRCMSIRLDTTDGHTHDLELSEVHRTVTVPANSTVSESVICGDLEKGIVASYDIPAGMLLAGHDPQPKSRVFKLVNTTGSPLEATIDLMCMGDRTGGPVVTTQIINSASVSSPTSDPDTDDRVAAATLRVDSAADPDPPQPPPSDQHAQASVSGDSARLAGKSVTVPVTCSGSDCDGTVQLRSVAGKGVRANRVLGSSDFTLAAGERGIARVRLKRFAAKLARKGKLKRAKVVLSVGGASSTKLVRLKRR